MGGGTAVIVGLGEGVAVGEDVGVTLPVAIGLIVLVGVTMEVRKVDCGLVVGDGDSSVGSDGSGEVGDGWGVADGSWTGVLVGVGGSSVGSGEVGDG